MENNIKNYDETITQRFSKVVRTTQRTEKQVKEKTDLLSEVKVLKRIFGKVYSFMNMYRTPKYKQCF